MNDDITRMLILDESCESRPYKDSVGKLTIGVGWNIDDKPMRHDEIMLRLKNDIHEAEEALSHLQWYMDLDNIRQLVMVDMVFNLGFPRFLMFKKMIAALRIGHYEDAAEEMADSKWARQVGVRAERLITMMRTGEMHPDYL